MNKTFSHPSRIIKFACGALALCVSLSAAASEGQSGGPYGPTPPAVVDAMLDLARVGPRDFVVDLGSGDGRIVSHDFDFGDWKPDRKIEVQTPEKYETSGAWVSTVHLWIVPAAIEGAWSGEKGGLRLDIKQRYQRFEGSVTRNGQTARLRGGRIEGTRIRFIAPRGDGAGRELYTGTVKDARIAGEVRGEGSAVIARWSATRVR